MNHQHDKLLFDLLSSAICGTKLNKTNVDLSSSDTLKALYDLSNKHDLSHLICHALELNGLLDRNVIRTEGNIHQKFYKSKLLAIFRAQQLNVEYDLIFSAFENEKIPFVPLKGSVLRFYYSEPWMRTSCDIDVLVHEEDLKKAISLLVEQHGYKLNKKGAHDVSLSSESGQHIELHYCLIEGGLANSSTDILSEVWDHVSLKEGCSYHYEMSDEFFYFYHIAHMAKHFENGGCGIRSFIDMWLLKERNDINFDVCNALLERAGLLKFSEACKKLCGVWFDNDSATEISEKMHSYIIFGGVYGTNSNRIPVKQQKKGGRAGYALYKIFLPYDVIKFYYPILQKHKWLTPFIEVVRWFQILFQGNLKNSMKELGYGSLNKNEVDDIPQFLCEIGLITK